MKTYEPIDKPAGKLRKVKHDPPPFGRAFKAQFYRRGSRLYCCLTNNLPKFTKRYLKQVSRVWLGLQSGKKQWYIVTRTKQD
jgi:hypothetical protein